MGTMLVASIVEYWSIRFNSRIPFYSYLQEINSVKFFGCYIYKAMYQKRDLLEPILIRQTTF